MEDQTKLSIIQRKGEGKTNQAIADELGLSRQAVSDFLLRKTWKDWWEQYDSMLVRDGEQGPRILFLDLEVSASIVAAFSMFRHFSTPDHIIEFPYILTFAANWLSDDPEDIVCKGLDDYPLFKEDHKNDRLIVEELWSYFDEADIVVIQNEGFDRGWFTQRCAYHGLPEPSPYRVLCTLKGDKKAMSLPSNSLGYVTKYFDLPHDKLKHDGIEVWISCWKGEQYGFDRMKAYNIGDIPTLRELYLTIRAYIPNHPNVAIYYPFDGDMRCNVCGSKGLVDLEKQAYTNLSSFDAYRCTNCGSVQRSGVSNTSSQERKQLGRNIVK